MLLTVTLNPAIDKTYRLAAANAPGSVLRVRHMSATPGGKGLNVSKAARALGERVTATGFLAGHAGDWVQERLETEGVLCSFERMPGETRTCISIVEPDGRQTEFLEPGPDVPPPSLAAFLARFERLAQAAQVVTLSGSAPAGVPEDIYARLIAVCRRAGRPVLLDSSGALLRAGAAARPDAIKPNLEELSQLVGRPVPDDAEEAARACRPLCAAGVGLAVASLGAGGAVAVTSDCALHAIPPRIRAVSATGSGDSFVAGLAAGMRRGLPLPDALRLATATAAANALNMETGRVRPEDATALSREVRVVPLRAS